MDYSIEPLTSTTLDEALVLLDKVFGHNLHDQKLYHNAFRGSLDPTKYVLLFGRKVKPSYLQYYVVLNRTGKVIGTTGHYVHAEDGNDRIGFGWFCVDSKYRGKGIGTKLLNFTIEKARKLGKKVLYLWTSTEPYEQLSHQMYARRGFVIVSREKVPHDKFEIINMELKL